MKIENWDIDKIKPYENNPRNNDQGVDAVAKSIKEFNWQQPIVVDKDNVIIVGHTRYKAAKKLGFDEVPVVVADELTPKQVKAYRLADNKTGEIAVWDNKELLKELEDFKDSDIFTGFKSSDIFNNVLDETDNSPLEENKDGVTYSISLKTQNNNIYKKVKQFIDSVGGTTDE